MRQSAERLQAYSREYCSNTSLARVKGTSGKSTTNSQSSYKVEPMICRIRRWRTIISKRRMTKPRILLSLTFRCQTIRVISLLETGDVSHSCGYLSGTCPTWEDYDSEQHGRHIWETDTQIRSLSGIGTHNSLIYLMTSVIYTLHVMDEISPSGRVACLFYIDLLNKATERNAHRHGQMIGGFYGSYTLLWICTEKW